ncbi:MAG: septal ring lytic transglycosylase RlpA family protein [Treponema sp.]|nr:septal ring lytic transglycosylase RlpA family protein [Treponema sp.]
MKRNVVLFLIGLGLVGICGAQAPNSQFGIFSQEGIASWYGAEFGGRPTASGEIFAPGQLTAAHPILPFGTMLKVTNTHNNKSVVVRVNDRGPFVSARIIDLSQGAAEQLDMIATGTAPVLVESLEAIALPQDSGRPVRPLTQEILSPPAEPVPRTSAARPGPGTVTPPASAPVPAAVSVPETPAPVVADVFTSPPQTAERTAPVRQNQSPAVEAAAQSEPAPQPVAVIPEPAAASQPVSLPPEPAAASQPVSLPPEPATVSQPVSLPPAVIKPGIPPADTGKSYRIQIGAFRMARYAVDAFDRLKGIGLNPAYERIGEIYRVVLADIKAQDVESIAGKLGNAGFTEAIIREEM